MTTTSIQQVSDVTNTIYDPQVNLLGPAFAIFHIFQSRVFHHCILNGSTFTIPAFLAFFSPSTSTCNMTRLLWCGLL